MMAYKKLRLPLAHLDCDHTLNANEQNRQQASTRQLATASTSEVPSDSVPVLSLQIAETEPKVSTTPTSRTCMLSLTMSLQPIHCAIMMQREMLVGMAAAVRVIAMRIT